MVKNLLFISIISLSFFSACKNTAPTETANSENINSETAASAFADINAAEFKSKIGQPETVILDVRTPEETAGGMIEGAVEMNFYAGDFQTKLRQLDKDKTYLVYCKVGGRSGNTCEMMKEAGFKSAYNLIGGYDAWPDK